MKADLAICSHVVDASGLCISVSLILDFELDFSSCAIWDGFCKSSHICQLIFITETLHLVIQSRIAEMPPSVAIMVLIFSSLANFYVCGTRQISVENNYV